MAIPPPAPEGYDDRAAILALIREAQRKKEALPTTTRSAAATSTALSLHRARLPSTC